ncbi:hypothetical protein Tco_1174289, partial [Tanacetum coccineum]
ATSEENVVLEWGSEHESEHLEDSQLNFDEEEKKDNDGDGDDEDEDDDHVSDSQDTDDEDAETESDKDEIYKYKIQVHKDADVEMKQAETVEHKNKEKVEMTDAVKSDVEKTAEEKALSLPQVTPTISIVQQTTTPIPTPLITIEAPTITTDVLESDALTAVQLRVAKLEKDVSELKKIDHSIEALASLKHTADLIQKYSVKPAPESSKIQSPTVDPEQEYEKSALEIRKAKKELSEKKKMSKYTIKSTDKAALKEYDQKSALYQTMHENKSFNRNPANHALYHALMEALIEDENAMDKGVADTVKDHKRQHEDDDEDPPAGQNQG